LDVEKTVNHVAQWIKEQVKNSNGKGTVFGLSGGLDSAVIAAFCRKVFSAEECLGVYMPCFNSDAERQDALFLANALDITWLEIDLESSFLSLEEALKGVKVERNHQLAKANIKPRLRMTTLYYLAAVKGFRVVGTSNRSEMEVGYFTKYGDGAADLLPLADFLKKEVREMAFYLGVPEQIIYKKPSGGLWEGQTDEGELGFSYDQLDQYLEKGIAEVSVKERIEQLIQGSQHKKRMPPKYSRE